ncbi:MAG: hypothetical protein JXA10_06720 [Anaerolineae bacterium]|nr:hypothetical protein [Anaerolineae bacterium]
MRRKTLLWLVLILALALVLAACGDDDNSGDSDTTTTGSSDPTPTTEAGGDETGSDTEIILEDETIGDSGGLGLDTGLNVPAPGAGGNDLGSAFPGCNDLESDECPIPFDPALVGMDGEASSGGVTVNYPTRYFGATTSAEGVLITISPSDQNKFEFKGTFEIYFADSIEDALAELDDLPGEAENADWITESLTGVISVVNDDNADPFTTTAIGAFTLMNDPAERVIVVKATTNGKFGWYFHTKMYEAILDSLVVAAE